MPIHDWTRVPSGLFHHFHQDWLVEIARTMNRGYLPKGLSALVEQSTKIAYDSNVPIINPPLTQIVRRTTKGFYPIRPNRAVVRHRLGRIVAVIEIISPGDKDRRSALRDFVEMTIDFLRKGIHLLIVDLFPPTPRDPFGIHKVIWDEITEEDFTFPEGKDRILASYEVGGVRAAYVHPVGVGDALPDMPLFLANDFPIRVPLEITYQATWDASPEEMRVAVETGVMPEPDEE